MADRLLANPVIEQSEVTILGAVEAATGNGVTR
jgi:phosphoribosylformylglycinamidine (FGAM) synthase PurS component